MSSWLNNIRDRLTSALQSMARNLLVAYLAVAIHILICNFFPISSYIFSSSSLYEVALKIFNLLVFSSVCAVFVAYLITINKSIAKYILLMLNLAACIYNYYFINFGIVMNDQLLLSMLFSLESNDIWSSMDWKIFFYVPAFFLTSTIALLLAFKFSADISVKINLQVIGLLLIDKLLATIFLSIILVGLLIGMFLYPILFYGVNTISEQLMPSYVLSRYPQIVKTHNSRKAVELTDYADYQFYNNMLDRNEPLVIVLVIGESLRSDRLSINGYHKPTTPLMQEIENLFSFKDVRACSTATATTIPCMLTDYSYVDWMDYLVSESYKPKYSVVNVFNSLDFDSVWLSSTNKDTGIYLNSNFNSAKQVILSNELRKKYLSKIKDFSDLLLVEGIDNKVEHNTIYILGTMGSHRTYSARYPQEFAKFTPDKGDSLEAINNAYDNTVVYFDNFIYQLTQKLANRNALLIYTSDHGESLGENGIYLHGAPIKTAPPEQLNVPMIVWMSDKFISNNPSSHANINQWHKLNRSGKVKFSHDFIFHSLIACAGIKSKTGKLNDSLNLCSDGFKQYLH